MFNSKVYLSVTQVLGMAAGIDQADAVCLGYIRPVVMRADYEVNSSEAGKKVQTLAFKVVGLAASGSGMNGNDHYLRVFQSFQEACLQNTATTSLIR